MIPLWSRCRKPLAGIGRAASEAPTSIFTPVRHGTTIPIILLETIPNRGAKGETISVKRGFARNCLIPKKMAVYATDENRQRLAHLKNRSPEEVREDELKLEQHRKLVELQQTGLEFHRSSSSTTTLFGSVSDTDVKAQLDALGFTKYTLKMDTLKSTGLHSIKVNNTKIVVKIVDMDVSKATASTQIEESKEPSEFFAEKST